MDTPFIFLTTSDVFSIFPKKEGDLPKHVSEDAELLGEDRFFYSTGKLEAALAEGKRPIVITSRSRLGTHDDWWLALIPGESGANSGAKDVHVMGLTKALYVGEEYGRELEGSFTRYCKSVVESYGLSWPEEETEPGTPMFWLQAFRVLNGGAR